MKENRHKVPFGVLGLVLAIGVVYGDIGTSPLYVMKAIISALPAGKMANPDYILGAVSCVIWTLTIQTTVKYVVITLRADNNGEGGILSLYALIRQKYRWAYFIAAIGAATLLADGVITPAITVMTAMEGLNVIVPEIPVIPATITIVAGIFLLQPLGTSSLGRFFGSIMLVWFLTLGILGFGRFIGDFSVLRAFNPYYAVKFLIEAPHTLVILGAIFLCTTGAEALYSDLGHCGLKNIRVSWIFVKSMLILNYLGQAAWIISHPNLINHGVNPFFAMMPSWFTFVGVVLATLAAVVASQALISGSFTVISEAISLNLWPNVKIKYPTNIKGQMFIPSINWFLMISCIVIVVSFKSSANLEAAYGLSITLSMLMTTSLLFLYMLKRQVSLWVSIGLSAFFLIIELGFFVANMQKFAHGGFASLLIAGVIFFMMYSWYNGRRIKQHYTNFDQVDNKYIERINNMSQDHTIEKTATNLVFITRAKNKNALESKITYSLFQKKPKRADTYWFVNIRRTDSPYEFGYSVKTFIEKKIFRLDINVGFKIGLHTDQYVRLITNELERTGQVDLSSRYPSLPDTKGDFTFVVVDRIFRNVDLSVKQKIMLGWYNIIKRFATSDTQMYDLDPSFAMVETVPLTDVQSNHKELNRLLNIEKKEAEKEQEV
ncbi:KUP system potassium uptake protein [Dysgonomonas sp. PH5-45]|uniref:KUP/HAK/KT family potassium transporter n=1 Tax=unclassified Dysgonomonas TaxID=2630389 RepID=UPI00247364A4|nr:MULTISPECIES: KUP/HAK/KT family potassium transporter [unclassified Dysgonomonas]MDH6353741.1 KUP system potassium uptake protein [Dysgonomonas sp. PH5-45]MDH6386644.1 KUP system potassium uptake protein [Dysgonomonas sp. PH5-37]